MSTRLRIIRCLAPIILAFSVGACVSDKPASNEPERPASEQPDPRIRASIRMLAPFFKPMGRPQPADWLTAYNEPGQTFDEYLASAPTLPTPESQTIYVLPLGKFSPNQMKVIEIAAGYLEVFYDLPVRRLPARVFTATSPNVRFNELMRSRQVKTGYILDNVLPPLLPNDAAALIAFTAEDLYPDPSMNSTLR